MKNEGLRKTKEGLCASSKPCFQELEGKYRDILGKIQMKRNWQH